MENASEALMMAFGVLIFVLALTVAITSFGQAREVSDLVIHTADKTTYYEYESATGGTSQNRTVGLETIIPTLYKYYKENYTVLFREGKQDPNTREITNTAPFKLYVTPSRYKSGVRFLWGQENPVTHKSTYDELMQTKYAPYFKNGYTEDGNTTIFSFDLDEETLRHEPWAGNPEKSKENVDRFLYGETYKNPSNNEDYINYGLTENIGHGGFIGQYRTNNWKFVETIGEYEQKQENKKWEYSESTGGFESTIDTNDGKSVNKKKKRVIIFTKVN